MPILQSKKLRGLFNDPDSGTHAGRNLRERERKPTGENFPEKNGMFSLDRDWSSLSRLHAFYSQAFVAAMKSIHKASIKHRNIRADNLVIHPETGKLAIIDFDRTKFPLENFGYYSGEMESLKDLLEGWLTPDSYH